MEATHRRHCGLHRRPGDLSIGHRQSQNASEYNANGALCALTRPISRPRRFRVAGAVVHYLLFVVRRESISHDCDVLFKIAGEGQALLLASAEGPVLAMRASQPGLLQTIGNIVRLEGARYVIYRPNSNLRGDGR